MDGGPNAQSAMLQFLKQVNEKAREKGIIPDSLSGDIGTIPGDDLFTAIRRIATMHGKIHWKRMLMVIHIHLVLYILSYVLLKCLF